MKFMCWSKDWFAAVASGVVVVALSLSYFSESLPKAGELPR